MGWNFRGKTFPSPPLTALLPPNRNERGVGKSLNGAGPRAGGLTWVGQGPTLPFTGCVNFVQMGREVIPECSGGPNVTLKVVPEAAGGVPL